MSFAAWVSGAGESPQTIDNLDYHLSTLFPPVRPRGYVEVRYLDAQPRATWHHPLVLLSALLSSRAVTDRACELTEQCADLWLTAARDGLRDRTLRRAARALVTLAADHLDDTLSSDITQDLVDELDCRTATANARSQPA